MIKKLLLCFLLSTELFLCPAQPTKLPAHTEVLVAVELQQTVPPIFRDLFRDDTLRTLVYYYKGMSMYRLEYQYDSSVIVRGSKYDSPVSRGDTKESDTIKITRPSLSLCSEKRFHFVVFKNGDRYGYNYDPHADTLFRRSGRVFLDSALKDERHSETILYCSFLDDHPVLISSRENKDSGTMQQVYDLWDKADSNKLGTYYLSFNKRLTNIDVSLSQQFDNLQHSKLCKALVVTYKAAFKQCDWGVDQIAFFYSLSKIPVQNGEEIMGYFERFMKDNEKAISHWLLAGLQICTSVFNLWSSDNKCSEKKVNKASPPNPLS